MRKLILILFTVSVANASDPHWINKVSFDDATNYYFVQSTQSKLINNPWERKALRQRALQDGLRQIIGTRTSFESRATQTIESAEINTSSVEMFPEADVKKFSERDLFIKDDLIFILYSWPKTEVQKVLQNLNGEMRIPADEVQGDESINSHLIVNSEPQGAEVYIDGIRWGTTPLDLRNRIALGPHKILLEHPQLETLELDEQITSQLKKIDVVLKPLEIVMQLTSNPEGAAVMVDGEYKGQTPTSLRFLVTPKESKKKLTFEHPQALTQNFSIQLNKNSNTQIHVDMVLRPSVVIFGCEPSPCKFQIGEITGELQNRFERKNIKPGDYELVIAKEGFHTKKITFTATPGEAIQLGIVRLEKDIRANRMTGFQLGLAYSGGDFPLKDGMAYMGYDVNFSFLLSAFVFNVGGSAFSIEESDTSTTYKGSAVQTYVGWGLRISDYRLLLLSKSKEWKVTDNTYYGSSKKPNEYSLKGRSLKLDMPIDDYFRWSIEGGKLYYENTEKYESNYSIGIAVEF